MGEIGPVITRAGKKVVIRREQGLKLRARKRERRQRKECAPDSMRLSAPTCPQAAQKSCNQQTPPEFMKITE